MWRQRDKKEKTAHTPDHVGVVRLLEERDLTDGSGGDALVLRLQADLLQGDHLAGGAVLRLVHNTVRPLPDLLQPLVVLQRGSHGGPSQKHTTLSPSCQKKKSTFFHVFLFSHFGFVTATA